MYEIRVLRLIIETMRNLASPIKNLFVTTLAIFYIFSVLGSFFFGGKVTVYSPEILSDLTIPQFYYLVNFNDVISSFVTLFILLVVNNWDVAVQMFVDVSNGNTAYRVYFILFYYFGVIMCINILVSFAIDMYNAVSRLDEQKT